LLLGEDFQPWFETSSNGSNIFQTKVPWREGQHWRGRGESLQLQSSVKKLCFSFVAVKWQNMTHWLSLESFSNR